MRVRKHCLALAVSLGFLGQSSAAETHRSTATDPVIMKFDGGLVLEVEYVEVANYPLLPKPSWLAGHLYFFTDGYPRNDDPLLDADTLLTETHPGEVRWVFDQFLTYKGWRLGQMPLPDCPDGIDPSICRMAPPQSPNIWAIVGSEPDGCRGPTLMTGFGRVEHVTRRRSPAALDDIYTAVEPISNVRWVGRIAGTDMVFLATLVSAIPVTADERRAVIEQFSINCGLQ